MFQALGGTLLIKSHIFKQMLFPVYSCNYIPLYQSARFTVREQNPDRDTRADQGAGDKSSGHGAAHRPWGAPGTGTAECQDSVTTEGTDPCANRFKKCPAIASSFFEKLIYSELHLKLPSFAPLLFCSIQGLLVFNGAVHRAHPAHTTASPSHFQPPRAAALQLPSRHGWPDTQHQRRVTGTAQRTRTQHHRPSTAGILPKDPALTHNRAIPENIPNEPFLQNNILKQKHCWVGAQVCVCACFCLFMSYTDSTEFKHEEGFPFLQCRNSVLTIISAILFTC